MSDTHSEAPLHATLPEVYNLVASTRREVLDKIDDFSTEVRTSLGSHEHRLTIAEEHLAHHASTIDRIQATQSKVSDGIADLYMQQKEDEAATKALADARRYRWTIREKTFAAATALGLCAAAFAALFH